MPVVCPPTVMLVGSDPDVVTAITTILAARDIVTQGGDATRPDCPTIHATIATRDDGHLVVTIERADQTPVERGVDDPTTAATVIESWTRRDLGSPLLGIRAMPRRVASAPAPSELRVDEPVRVPVNTTTRGIQLFAAAETAMATDRTVWGGVQVGASVGLGRVQGAVRLRADAVANAPSAFGNFDRSNKELLVGLDVPIALHHARLTPGVAVGLGNMHTHVEESQLGGETGGLRADAHVTLSVPITRGFALDFALAADLTQATHVETHTTMELPAEPRGIVHLAIGLRYGSL